MRLVKRMPGSDLKPEGSLGLNGEFAVAHVEIAERAAIVLIAVVLAEYNIGLFAGLKLPEKPGTVANGIGDVVVLDEVRPAHVRGEVEAEIKG